MPDSSAPPTAEPQPRSASPHRRVAILLAAAVLAGAGVVLADWLTCLPDGVTVSYVGRQRCIECHQQQGQQWLGSHHDLAMDVATEETVLGDFDGAQLEHFGITSRMFRRDGKFMIHTEGPDGQMADFEIKYVFGVDPLQQYMVEFDRQPGQGDDEVARLQVLRISWDTHDKRWFYLSPPDVDEKLSPEDDLHWTGVAQRWNNMCADCHSTNLRRNFDVASKTYHTTFSEIDVSCEACHGPGSVHVQLAEQNSLFWDRKRGYGLPRLKDKKNTDIQITACAPCHSRRRLVMPGYHAGDDFFDHFALETLQPQTYHCDGQVLDEVYVTGSFIQSKMYHKQIRCTDCHDPHTAKLLHEGNKVCTSCHQHPAGRYDNPAHHFHEVGSEGAKCVNCHMPETTYMAVDPRRDHSLRIPRPDLSVATGSPNVCTGCHLEKASLPEEQRERLTQYQDWLRAARPVDGRPGDPQVLAELRRLDRWAAQQCDQWYGENRDSKRSHFAEGLHRLWESPEDADVAAEVVRRWVRPATPALIRASMLASLLSTPLSAPLEEMRESLSDPSPIVRQAAVASFENLIPSRTELGELDPRSVAGVADQIRPRVRPLWPLLDDPARSVRIEAARVLSRVPPAVLPHVSDRLQRESLDKAFGELKETILVGRDRGGAHAVLGSLYENLGADDKAEQAYRTAVHIEPQLAGPRTNLAALLDRRIAKLQAAAQAAVQQRDQDTYVESMQKAEELRGAAQQLRAEELPLLQRDAELAPYNAAIQHRLGMILYLNDDLEAAEAALRRAVELDADAPRYVLMLALLLEKRENFREALRYARRLVELAPQDAGYQQLLRNIESRVTAGPQLRP